MNHTTDLSFIISENKRKGMIFSYFVGAIWIVGALITIQNFYLSLVMGGELGQRYSSYNADNVGFLIFFGLVWLGHRWYPKLMRHLFLATVIIGTVFFFDIQFLDKIFVALSLPVIMAAFLIQPIYSFIYYVYILAIFGFRLSLNGLSIMDEQYFVGLVSLIVIAVVAWLIAQSLEKSLAETRALNRELDQRVQDRTRELAEALSRETATAVRNTTILESIADGVLFFDANDRVVIANPAANKLAKQNLQLLTLKDILATVGDKAREAVQAWLNGEKPADQSNVKFEWHKRTISATVAPVTLSTPNGYHPLYVGNVMVLRDFTKEAELEKAKDLFLGMVSHELRTPMSAIQGYVDILLETEKNNISSKGYEHLETIEASIKQLLKLANELIDLSRMESGEIDLYCQWVDIETIARSAAKIVEQEFSSRNLSLTVKLEQNLPKLYVDRSRILQILLNLLSNAYKYTAQGGATLEITQSDEWINISVIDTGVGIKEMDKAKMFDRFFRASDRFVQQAGGTGLGLNISKGLTELHGG
ncbi:MAG: ATP-binding protein, partial [Chloroflexota bacterium]